MIQYSRTIQQWVSTQRNTTHCRNRRPKTPIIDELARTSAGPVGREALERLGGDDLFGLIGQITHHPAVETTCHRAVSSSQVHPPWVSAKGAVDNDLVHSALEEGELLIIELGDDQLRDPAGVDGRCLT